MSIVEDKRDDINIITIHGRLDAHSSNELEERLSTLAQTHQARIIVNLSSLEYISSAGLRVLLAALKKAQGHQGDMRLVGLQPSVRQVFDIVGFTKLFRIFETEADALSGAPSW